MGPLPHQDNRPDLAKELDRWGFSSSLAETVKQSGYVLHPSGYVLDTFYGSAFPTGHIPLEKFLGYLKGNGYPYPPFAPPRFTVRSLRDATEQLAGNITDRHADRLCLRGQNGEYSFRRSIPNPRMKDATGAEPSVMPSFWRKFSGKWEERFNQRYLQLFQRVPNPDLLIYHGIPNWERLAEINTAKYGEHDMSDLEDFPDWASQEYYRRFINFKVEGTHRDDIPLVEQHYGVPTPSLDVTSDLAVALFFASHRFRQDGHGRAYFEPYSSNDAPRVIYVFCISGFRATMEGLHDLPTFQHAPPLRPTRQKCGLVYFGERAINACLTDCHCVMELSPDFDGSDLPDAQELFPGRDEDPFYNLMLELRDRYPDMMTEFVEYVY